MVSREGTETQRTSYRQRIFQPRRTQRSRRHKSFDKKKLEALLCELSVSVVKYPLCELGGSVVNPGYGFTKKTSSQCGFSLALAANPHHNNSTILMSTLDEV